MRTKTFLVTAALSVAAATSWAQVYSVNAVGYVNLTLRSSPTVPPTKGTIIANPLNGTNNNLNTILPLADTYDGTVIYRFNPTSQTYADPVSFIAGFGWYNPGDPAGTPPDIAPGEACWIFPVGPDPLSATFVGEVPQGHLVNALPAANKLAMVSSIVPQAAPLGDEVTANTLGFAAEDGDTAYLFNPTSQSYKDPYGYILGFGWYSNNADDPGPGGPTIDVATGFFIQKAPAAAKTAWTRDFSVN